jgi:2-polyprenyl-3-methyl-5-hydroxy-6-metoxy-1,4-benzoquinol methylase
MTKSKLQATLFHHSAHLPEQDLLALATFCPFCNSAERKPIAVLQQAPEVLLLSCNTCHAASASRMPTPEALENYYSHYYDDKEEKVTLDTPERMANHIIKYARPSISDLTGRDVCLLDYGGGDGSISIKVSHKLLGLGARSVNITLVDYDRSTMEALDQRIQIYRPYDLTQIVNQSMDIVIASAIIEHIPEPREVLIKLFSTLKPKGVFYARTPYVTPLSRLAGMFNSKFDFTFPAHVHDLGAKFWNNVINILPLDGEYQLLRSTPSIVETTFKQHFLRTLAAYLLKIPGYIFKETYGFVGGWEVFFHRRH